jgi:hypothetical protein
MASIKSRKSRVCHFIPPPDLRKAEGQAEIPQRANILFAKILGQELGIQIPQTTVHGLIGVPPRSQTRILVSKQVRTLYNMPDSGLDPRGRKRTLSRKDIASIADYLEDPITSLDDKNKPWLDIAIDTGIDRLRFGFPPSRPTHWEPTNWVGK